jgi:hypothetical protein
LFIKRTCGQRLVRYDMALSAPKCRLSNYNRYAGSTTKAMGGRRSPLALWVGVESAQLNLEGRCPPPMRVSLSEIEMNIRICRPNVAKHAIVGVLSLLLALGIGAVHAAIPGSERIDLDALYAQTDGVSWTSSTGWEGAAGTECSWQGITCDNAGDHVIVVQLPGNNLTGTVPDISGLTALQVLDLSTNNLTGGAPDLSNLTALQEVLLGGNRLVGPAPIPPNPSSLEDAESSLCPNSLGPVSTPQSASDLIWDRATDDDPWTEGCSTAPVITPTAATPILDRASLLLLLGLLAIAGAVASRLRV